MNQFLLSADGYSAINARIRAEVERGSLNHTWLPSLVEQTHELYLRPDFIEPRLPHFRSMFLQGALAWPDRQEPGRSWFSSSLLSHVRLRRQALASIKRGFSETLARLGQEFIEFEEDLIGDPYHSRRFVFWGKPETEANLRSGFFYALLEKFCPLDSIKSILEIGGGFGALAGRVFLKHPNVRYYLTELPRVAILACYYLTKKCGATLAHDHPPPPSAGPMVLMPWVLPDLQDRVEWAINTSSFQHMNEANLRFYFSHLRRLSVGHIFSLNREEALREGEFPFLQTAREFGYEVKVRHLLAPWSDKHYVHLLDSK